MNPTDSLPLRDIHLPDPVSWWPPAAGWWFVLLFSLLAIWMIVVWVKKLTKPVLKKGAKAEILKVMAEYKQHQNKQLLIQQLSISLRRIGISYLPRNENAGLTGKDWYQKMNQLVEKDQLSEEMILLLSEGPYQQNPELDDEKINILVDQVQHWVAALHREKSNA